MLFVLRHAFLLVKGVPFNFPAPRFPIYILGLSWMKTAYRFFAAIKFNMAHNTDVVRK